MPDDLIFPAPPHGLTAEEIDLLDTPSCEWEEDDEIRDLPLTLFYGETAGMREAGDRYLPKEPGETNRSHQARLRRSALTNLYKVGVNGLVARVIADEITAGPDVPLVMAGRRADPEKGVSAVEGWLDNVDLQGNNLTQYATEWLRDAINGGISFTLVDYHAPAVLQRPNGVLDVPAPSEERAMGRRPFWTRYSARDVIDAVAVATGPQHWRFLMLRVREDIAPETGPRFNRKPQRHVRLYVAGDPMAVPGTPESFAAWHLFRKLTDAEVAANPDGAKLVYVTSGSLRPHVDLPVRELYGERLSFGRGKPLFVTGAELQGQHWWLASDLANGRHMGLVYVWHRSGVTKDEASGQTTLGFGRMFWSTNPQARMETVSPPVEVYASAEDALAKLEERLRLVMREPFTIQDASNVTAKSDELRNKPSQSQAQAQAKALQDALNSLLGITAKWADIKTGAGTVNVVSNGLVELPKDKILEGALKLADGSTEPRISDQTLLELFQSLGGMPSGWTVKEELARLAAQREERRKAALQAAEDFIAPKATAMPGGVPATAVPPQQQPAVQ